MTLFLNLYYSAEYLDGLFKEIGKLFYLPCITFGRFLSWLLRADLKGTEHTLKKDALYLNEPKFRCSM